MADFYCEYCGTKSSSVSGLTSGWCSKHPTTPGKGHHKLYEGSEKTQYVCKYCGTKSSSVSSLTSGWCSKHPATPGKGHHSPAL